MPKQLIKTLCVPILLTTLLCLSIDVMALANQQSHDSTVYDDSLVVTTLSKDLYKPWGISALPTDKAQSLFLITERNGAVRLFDNNTGLMSKANERFVDMVYESGQGGMLDVIAHPNFNQNGWVYFTFAAGHQFSNGTTLARAKLTLNRLDNGQKSNASSSSKFAIPEFELSDVTILYRASPMKAATYHFAGRMAFLPDNTLVFGVGDGYTYMKDAQKLDSHLGKIIRLTEDGKVPQDNPYVEVTGALPEIYSIGHRNPQGLAYDNTRGLLFSNEHGPKGGDEINVIKAKLNYGWPEITHGIDYSGLEITPHSSKPGMESPLVDWTPSIAPSSLVIYQGAEFPEFKGSLINTALKYQELRVVELAANDAIINEAQGESISHSGLTLAKQTTYLKSLKERLRDIAVDERGRLLLITDSGKLLRVSKVEG